MLIGSNGGENFAWECPVKSVGIPIELYESAMGKYFMGYAGRLAFGGERRAWARLYNPPHSGVNLHVNVWTVTDISEVPYQAEFWFNADPPGSYSEAFSTTTNTAIRPAPEAKIKLQLASDAVGDPSGGVRAFVRIGEPGTTLVETENGKLIFPPGGNFLVYLSALVSSSAPVTGRVAFGWWEEEICRPCCCQD